MRMTHLSRASWHLSERNVTYLLLRSRRRRRRSEALPLGRRRVVGLAREREPGDEVRRAEGRLIEEIPEHLKPKNKRLRNPLVD